MDGLKHVVVVLVVCLCFTAAGGSVRDRDVPERTATIPGVSMRLGGLRITSKAIELRCEVRNDSKQDIWLFSGGEGWDDALGRAALFRDIDGETLLVLRRMNVPEHCQFYLVSPSATYATYDRLPAGQSVVETLFVNLPIKIPEPLFVSTPICIPKTLIYRGFAEPADRDVRVATRLAFEIGCYTTEFLNSAFKDKMMRHPTYIRFGGIEDRVVVSNNPFGWLWRHEHVIRMTIEGMSIPYGDWLDFVRDDSRTEVPGLSKLELHFPGKPRKEPEEPEPEPTPLDQLEALFYDFSLGVEDYRYARRLFGVDEDLFNDAARAIADAYLQIAQGELDPKDLPVRLDEAGSQACRDRVLKDLEARAAATDRDSKEKAD